MVRGLRATFHDRFSDYFSPESLKRFNEEIDGRFSGDRAEVTEVKRGLRADARLQGLAGRQGGDRGGRQ